MQTLRIQPRSKRQRTPAHPWVFAGEVDAAPDPRLDGQGVLCRDAQGRLLGSGLCNTRSQLIWRRYHTGQIPFDEAFIRAALDRALARRGIGRAPNRPGSMNPITSVVTEARRLVWSDSDHLPGLVVDQYGSCLVVQALTLGIDQRLPLIAEHLCRRLSPEVIIARNDAPVREKEGLPLAVQVLHPAGFSLDRLGDPGQWVNIAGIELWADPLGGQKTGLYLDQADQYRRVAEYAPGRRVLDTFCNEGGFALACRQAGAVEVTGVDSSGLALAHARRNAERNGLEVGFVEANVFDYFKATRRRRWDLIILDPPPFAPNRKSLPGALRGYKELNLRAFHSLDDGGILATYTCSHHLSHEAFRGVLDSAAADAGVAVRVIESCAQPQDHPVLLGFPESEYLRGFILEVSR